MYQMSDLVDQMIPQGEFLGSIDIYHKTEGPTNNAGNNRTRMIMISWITGLIEWTKVVDYILAFY